MLQFAAGTVTNPYCQKVECTPTLSEISLSVPGRLNAMCFDISSLTLPVHPMIYSAGELAFSIDLRTKTKICLFRDGRGEIVVEHSRRPSLVVHGALLMKKALNFTDSLRISCDNNFNLPHCGFGSSSAIISSVAIAINILYGRPLNDSALMKYIAQNHGEEIGPSQTELVHVQSIGGIPAVSLCRGGVVAIAGESVTIAQHEIPADFYFVCSQVEKTTSDALELMKQEEKLFPRMLDSSARYSKEISWRVLHLLLPSLVTGDFVTMFKVIRWQRFQTGSLETDGKMWPSMFEMIKILTEKYYSDQELISYSSNGPAIYVMTKDPDIWKKRFGEFGLESFVISPDNKGAIIEYSR
ncbi:MAG: GHMP family kinase ATP-binding protein [Nitrososphaerales archaeon]